MFKSNRSLFYIAFSFLTAYMGKAGLILYAADPDLDNPAVKAAIKAAVEKAVEDATAPLVAKRDELLTEVKNLRKGKSIDPEDYAKLEAEIETLKGDLAKSTKELKLANETATKATKQLESETGFTQKLLIDNGLLENLSKNGVTDPAYQKAAVAMLRSGVQIVVEGENRVAKVGDKALADHVAEWAKSDEGKRFAAAPGNSGGGGNGGGNKGGGGKTMTRAEFDAADQATRSTFSKEGGKVVD